MPRNVMKSKVWNENYKYLNGRSDANAIRTNNENLCVSDNEKYYTVAKGMFYFFMVEEQGKMKIVGLAVGN